MLQSDPIHYNTLRHLKYKGLCDTALYFVQLFYYKGFTNNDFYQRHYHAVWR